VIAPPRRNPSAVFLIRNALALYATFLRRPDVAQLLAMGLLARMPLGTLGLAMLFYVRELTGSFAIAGGTVGAYLAASACTAPALGRWIDRSGPRRPLLITGTVAPAALFLLGAAPALGLPQTWLFVLAGVAGAFAPPITVLTRTVWRYRFEDESNRRIAFALDTVLVELAFTLGPALTAGLLAVSSPLVAFGAAWCFSAAAAPIFLLSPAQKYWRNEPATERHLLGPLTEPRLLVVLAATFMLTFTFGLLEVGYPGFAVAAGTPALGGVLIAINSLGSAVGGIAYGGLHLRMPVERQLPRFLALMAVPLATQVVTTSPWLLAALALLAGLLIAPALTVVMLLVSAYAPARYAAEAFTWSATFIVGGVGAGMAIGGQLVEDHGAVAAFALAAVSILVAASCSLAFKSPVAPPPA